MKTIVQCDFDGTITQEDQSFLLLDAFASGNWRQLLREYREGRISVGCFNTRAFAMVKEDRQTLVDFVTHRVKIRAGFRELLAYCHKKGFQFIIISNGLDFYIEAVLRNIRVEGIEVFSAKAQFSSRGVEVQYIGPDSIQLEDNFKDAYTRLFLRNGYRIIYVGDGFSDISPAKQAHHVFARGELLSHFKEAKLDYTPFIDLNDVVNGLELLE